MNFRSYARAALCGGALLLAIDAAVELVIKVCQFHCAGDWMFTVSRILFLTHPMADRVFVASILFLTDGQGHFLHEWTPSTLETSLFYGLNLLEAFVYGLVLSIQARFLLPWLTGRGRPSQAS